MGFEEDEAFDNIELTQGELGVDGGLFGPRDKPKPTFKHTVTASLELVAAIKEKAGGGVSICAIEDGKVEIVVTGHIGGGLEKVIAETLPETERKGFSAAVAKYRAEVKDQLSPAEKGAGLEVPRLMAEIQGKLDSPTPTSSWSFTTGRCSIIHPAWTR